VSNAIRICALDELGQDEALKVDVGDVSIAIVKDGAGIVHAIGDVCTHGDISLSEGFVEGETLECWAHGSKFSLVTG
jgi:3-phenylpropionate/trans-cinnamate dioxygenase ferredoxin subunit